jgi:uracil-DNA glycosylase
MLKDIKLLSMDDEKLEQSWSSRLKKYFLSSDMKDLKKFLHNQDSVKNIIIYPSKDLRFSALRLTPFDKVKVVIIGQDPYHGKGQANGLAFSVSAQTKIPPSLKNIFTELETDLKQNPPENGDLSLWAKQGVLLLNSVLSVEEKKPGSHANKGWEQFTNTIIEHLSEEKENIVFMLWGKYAQEKGKFIDGKRHLKLSSPHPSPFSCYKGFFGCKHFSKANNFLISKNLNPISW